MNLELGIYLTSDYSEAESYAGNEGKVYEVSLDDNNLYNLVNPLTDKMKDLVKNELLENKRIYNQILKFNRKQYKVADKAAGLEFFHNKKKEWEEKDNTFYGNIPVVKKTNNGLVIFYTDYEDIDSAIDKLTGDDLHRILSADIDPDIFTSIIIKSGFDGIITHDNKWYILFRNEDKAKIMIESAKTLKLVEKASIDWNNYLTSEEVHKILSSSDVVNSIDDIINSKEFKDRLDDFKKSGWTLEQLIDNLLSFYWNKNLKEDSYTSNNLILCYRTIGKDELHSLCKKEIIYGKYNNAEENQNNSSSKDVVCFFVKPISWVDKNHRYMIECEFNMSEIELGNGTYYSSGDINNTLNWTGRRGKTESNIEEVYVKSYDLDDVKSFIVKSGLDNPLEYYEELLDKDKKGFQEYENTMKPSYKKKMIDWIAEEENIVKNIKTKNIKTLS